MNFSQMVLTIENQGYTKLNKLNKMIFHDKSSGLTNNWFSIICQAIG